jgi:HAD superfamily hydrolase (TIGR01509 family)
MDGTLTAPMLDFPAIKRDLGIGNRPILEAIAEMNPPEKAAAHAILDQHEQRAASASTLNPGCDQLLSWITHQQIPTAIITRNSRPCAQTVLARHNLSFQVVITREDARFKPDPAPLLLACQKLNVSPSHAWMIGDGQYDIEAGLAAHIKTIWLSHSNPKPFPAEPWKTMPDLIALTKLLQDAE